MRGGRGRGGEGGVGGKWSGKKMVYWVLGCLRMVMVNDEEGREKAVSGEVGEG